MISVFFGEDDGYNRTLALQSIDKNNKERGIEVVNRYDGFNNPISEVLEDLNSLSLFSEKKTVIFDHAYFLSTSVKQTKGTVKESSQDYDALIQYLASPEENVDLYFIVTGNLDSKSKVVSALKNLSAKIVHNSEMSEEDFIAFALSYANRQGKKIDRPGARLLYERTATMEGFKKHGDYSRFKNELDKMLLYTDNVFEDTVREMVFQPLNDNVFDLVSALFERDTKKALHIYQNLRKNAVEVLSLVPVISSQLRMMALLKYKLDTKASEEEIQRELMISPGRIYHLRKDVSKTSYYRLLRALSDLGEIEKGIKLEGDDADDRMTLYLSSFVRRYLR